MKLTLLPFIAVFGIFASAAHARDSKSTPSAPAPAPAEAPQPKATIAVVGDADRLTIGQDGFCGKRNEVSKPRNARFRIPAGKETHFFIRTSFTGEVVQTWCEGDYSFVPDADQVHIIRFTMNGNQCVLEVFQSVPGGTPKLMPVSRSPSQSCIGK
jgi:hypothetical protein